MNARIVVLLAESRDNLASHGGLRPSPGSVTKNSTARTVTKLEASRTSQQRPHEHRKRPIGKPFAAQIRCTFWPPSTHLRDF